MSQTSITIIGIIAAVATTAAFLPQAFKTFRTRRADDFSWAYVALFTAGVAMWLVYGLLRKDAAVIGANGTTLLLMFVIAGVKFAGRSRAE